MVNNVLPLTHRFKQTTIFFTRPPIAQINQQSKSQNIVRNQKIMSTHIEIFFIID
jgi:hypothetical protein